MPPNPSNPQPSMPPSMRAPPTNNNGKYVLALLLLGGGIAGLFALKTCTGEPPPATTPIATASVPQPSATLVVDDLPLPPVVEDAGPATTKSTTATAGNPCDVKSCNGTTTSDLESALAFRAKQAHRCYDSALANDSTLQGKMELQLRVASNGNLCTADVASNDMGTPTVAT
ncbi:MAG: hypothetical protein ACRELY_17820, partial [Polyangiaceae bacterium]